MQILLKYYVTVLKNKYFAVLCNILFMPQKSVRIYIFLPSQKYQFPSELKISINQTGETQFVE